MKVLRIVNWNEKFENNRTRELKRLDWFPIPNKHDGDSYTEFLDHPNGMAHYGAWVLIVAVASKCDPRGTLLRDGAVAHDARSLARKTRGSAKIFDEAMPRLLSIGWLEEIETPNACTSGSSDSNAINPASDCENPAPQCEQVPIEGNGIEGKIVNINRAGFALPADEREAVEWCAAAGVPPDFAKRLFNQCEATGYLDGAGRNIKSFSRYAQHRWQIEKDRQNDPRNKTKPKANHEAGF
jgi:hypothetical protein